MTREKNSSILFIFVNILYCVNVHYGAFQNLSLPAFITDKFTQATFTSYNDHETKHQ